MSKTHDMSSPRNAAAILVADPDLAFARRTAALLRQVGYRTEACAGGPRVARALADTSGESFDLVVADLSGAPTPDSNPNAPALVLVSGFSSIEDEVAALRSGAFGFLTKPVDEEQLVLTVGRAIEARGLARENARLRADLSGRFAFGRVVTRDPDMRRVLETARALAGTRATILIEGESGTGKTMLARAIHEQASADKSTAEAPPFVEVTCGALPSGLLESELFGHARGAFTGALRDRPGKFEAADGGTLFLDEIGNAPLELQQKLLRVLQDKTFERLGEVKTRSVDVRVIAATNEDLAALVRAGKFREDLLWRVRVVALRMPPLRERRGDVPLLVEHFLGVFRQEHGRPDLELDPACLPVLAAWPWRGNIRELEHCLERAVLLARGPRIAASDLGLEAPGASPGASPQPGLELSECLKSLFGGDRPPTLREALAVPEREIIRLALELHGGNRQATAKMLDVNRSTLFNKMRKHGLMDIHRENASPAEPSRGAAGSAPSA
ncbi:MAG: sigma-54 dependent transcriptional regulator [Planctomycetota bacterium]